MICRACLWAAASEAGSPGEPWRSVLAQVSRWAGYTVRNRDEDRYALILAEVEQRNAADLLARRGVGPMSEDGFTLDRPRAPGRYRVAAPDGDWEAIAEVEPGPRGLVCIPDDRSVPPMLVLAIPYGSLLWRREA